MISKEDKIKILRYWTENWQRGAKIWKEAPSDIQVSPEDMREFNVDCAMRHGTCCGDRIEGAGGRSINAVRMAMHELERLESEGRQEQRGGISLQGSHGNIFNSGNMTSPNITINITQNITVQIDALKERIDNDSEIDDSSREEVKNALEELKQTGRIDRIIRKLTGFAERYSAYGPPILQLLASILSQSPQ